MVFFMFMDTLCAASPPVKRLFSVKEQAVEVSRLDSLFISTSMPLLRAKATQEQSFPISNPATLMIGMDGKRSVLVLI